MKSLAVILIILLAFASGMAGLDKRNQDSLMVVPPPEKLPTAKDSIAVVNYVLFYTTLNVWLDSAKSSASVEPTLKTSLKLHLENHSDSILKGFQLESMTLYQDSSTKEIATYKLTLTNEKSPLDIPIHTLKNWTYSCTPLKLSATKIKPGMKLYSRIWARYNNGNHFISTKPVEIRVIP